MDKDLSFLGDSPVDLTPAEYREWLAAQEQKNAMIEEFKRAQDDFLKKMRDEWALRDRIRKENQAKAEEEAQRKYAISAEFDKDLEVLQENCLDNFFLRGCEGYCHICNLNFKFIEMMQLKNKFKPGQSY